MTVYNPNFDVIYCRHRHRRGGAGRAPNYSKCSTDGLMYIHMALVSFPDPEFGLGTIRNRNLIILHQQPYLHKIGPDFYPARACAKWG